MAAPERFADKSDSSCTAGAVHTWPFATFRGAEEFGRYRARADIAGLAAGSTRSRMTLNVIWLRDFGATQHCGACRYRDLLGTAQLFVAELTSCPFKCASLKQH